jgi:hypothetical protein
MGRSVHLIAGAATAAGLEGARKRCFLTPNPKSVSHDDLLEAAYLPFLRQWGDFEPPESSSKTFTNTFGAMEHYLLQFPPSEDNLQPFIRPDGTPAVEYKFAIPLEDLNHPVTKEPILFVGRFDMVGSYQTPSGPLICGVDDKTTGSITFDWASKWDMRGQFLGYLWALRQHNIQARHFVVNGIAILKTKNECRRALVMYPDHLISRWEHTMRRDISLMIKSFCDYSDHPEKLDSLYPYNFGDACESYGGCAFSTLCLAKDPSAFTSNYVPYLFNPLDIQPVKDQAQ